MNDFLKHIKLPGPTANLDYKPVVGRGSDAEIPKRNRQQHGQRIFKQLEQAWDKTKNVFLVSKPDRKGIYLEFVSSPGFELMIKSLEDLRQGIRLCNVRTEDEIIEDEKKEITYATVFIPNDKKQVFFDKVEKYLRENKNKKLINSIDELRTALLVKSFWTDAPELIPEDKPEWCEVWLRDERGRQTKEVIDNFESLLATQEINSKKGHIIFPERIVKLIFANRKQLQTLSIQSDDIAEYRKAKDTAEFFLNLAPFEQQEWVKDLLSRLSIEKDSQVSICILDTGVNNGHPLLAPVLQDKDCLTVEEDWGTHDNERQGHGTLMAGVAAYNNLQVLLESRDNITLYHNLESVKILPPRGGNNKELWGYITSQAISRAEIKAPDKKRIICCAVTAPEIQSNGRPSSWSGAIDMITSGVEDEQRRLFILAAGNVRNLKQSINYPDYQINDPVHDPAQSWNAITVGAYTSLVDLTDSILDNYVPVAQRNQLSPFSTTSIRWENNWPFKPEVLFEGGNLAVDKMDKESYEPNPEDLSLISTYYKPQERAFELFNMTSAATAQAAHFAAQIQAKYPEYWPETIRGLMVHSAHWPDELLNQFVNNTGSKQEIGYLMRIAGYGVPDLNKAMYCAKNSLTLISEAEIQPFIKHKNRSKRNEMHLYRLPWPVDVLNELGSTEVKMRITLSYFIEPGPGEIGWKDRYRYPSHGLRFRLNSPTETEKDFIKRINKAARADDEGKPDTVSPRKYWTVGTDNRDKGSIHSDIWTGTAAELASSNLIGIYPIIGWWKERAYLGKTNNKTRYSLIVSIETPEQEVDIYTPVATQIQQQITIK